MARQIYHGAVSMEWDSHLYIQFQPSNTQASAESTGWQSSEGTGEERAIGQGQICQGVRERRQLESILARLAGRQTVYEV